MVKRRNFGSSRDPLQVQISVRLRLPAGVKPTTARTQAAINYRLEHGYDHANATTKIIRWRNPSRPGQLSRWRQGNQEDAWATLGQWLRFSSVDVIQVRGR